MISCFAAILLALAGVAGASAVGVAAYAAHGLAHTHGDHAVALFNQATDFQLKHALALGLIGLLSERADGCARMTLRAAGVVMAAAILLFPSALYSSALGGPAGWAPYGGTAAIIAWIAFAVGALLAARGKSAA